MHSKNDKRDQQNLFLTGSFFEKISTITAIDKKWIKVLLYVTVLYNTVIFQKECGKLSEEKKTLEAIHTAAKAEFLDKGFRSASLRNIVKQAGVTTGAFYGYYKSKEELFDALVGEQYDTFMNHYKEAQENFTRLTPEEQHENMEEISGDSMIWMTDYAYEHFDAFKLILCCAEGTRYENMIHEMVEIEIEATHAYAEILKGLGNASYQIDSYLEHMLVSGLFSAYFEMIIHDIPYEKAKEYVRDLRKFYSAGWQKMMGF